MANKNILEVAFSKIQENEKTELESQKVDLSVVKALNILKSDAKSKVNASTNDIATAMKELDKVIGKMKSAEKELGVSLSDEISAVKKTWSKSKEALKKAQSLISDLASL